MTDDYYAAINALWPDPLPDLDATTARKAARLLYRAAVRKSWRGEVRVTSGARPTRIIGSVLWVNPDKGWRNFVHEMSHAVAPRHSPDHAQLEYAMVMMVLSKKWVRR